MREKKVLEEPVTGHACGNSRHGSRDVAGDDFLCEPGMHANSYHSLYPSSDLAATYFITRFPNGFTGCPRWAFF